MLLKYGNGDDVMTGFTGAVAKVYIEITHSTEKVTNKGIKKPLIDKMTPNDFYDATFKGKKNMLNKLVFNQKSLLCF